MIHLYSLHIWLTLRNGCVAWELTEKSGETLIKLTVIFNFFFLLPFCFPFFSSSSKRAAWLPDFALFAQFRGNFRVLKTNFDVRKSNFRVLKTNFNVRKSNFRVWKTNFRVLKTNFRVRKSIFRVRKK